MRCLSAFSVAHFLAASGKTFTSAGGVQPSLILASGLLVLLLFLLFLVDEALDLVLAGVVLAPLLGVLWQLLVVNLRLALDLDHRRLEAVLLGDAQLREHH